MIPDTGFVDLRLNRHDAQNEDSFWPSFTDIMTVVVMIFLLAMVILLVRNMELVNQLRATMEAERTAAELARMTGEEKDSLALKLIATENELSMLRMRLMRLEEDNKQQKDTISTQSQQVASLTGERDSLTDRVNRLIDETSRLKDSLDSANRSAEGLRIDLKKLNERYDVASKELGGLRKSKSELERELESSRTRLRDSDVRLSSLQEDYSDLKVKYDKLVKPARTARGKYVVEVRYSKVKGEFKIEYKENGETDFKAITRKNLDAHLAKLKKKHANSLYIKVIFPGKSGLSYNEAWSFTTHLHKNYDYYFQDAAANP